MKNLNRITVLLMAGMLLTSGQIFSENFTGKYSTPKQTVKVAKGAANPTELARILLQAIQENKFENLSPFLLDDEALALLKNKGSEDLKGLLQNSTAADIKNNLKTDYEEIIKQGISQTINWSEMALAETKMGKSSPKSPMVQPVTLTFTNMVKQPVQLILGTAKLNNRYYFFQNMKLKPLTKNILTGKAAG